jgi:hypothetical protein
MERAGYLALIFFGLFAFINAIHHPFIHDDVIFILNNPHITELSHWADAFRVPAATGGLNTYYRPLLEIFCRLEYHFFGPNPAGYHLLNVMVHVVNGLLLFALLKRLNLSEPVAWVIALLFLIHPVQTEAVACISGISNLLMALGIFLALHAYLNQWYTASFIGFAFAFLCKEQAVLFVPLVMVIDYSRGSKNHGAWFLWALAACSLMWLRQSMSGGASLLRDIMASPGELYLRLEAIPRDIGMYLQLIFFPYNLHYYRCTDILQSNLVAWVVALISILGIAYAYHRFAQHQALLVLSLGWFIAALLPVLNIAPLINEYSFIFTPEHFLYLPIIGILMVVVSLADQYLKHFRKPIFGLVVGTCLLFTWYQNTFWGSEIALFERMLQYEPDFGRGHFLLAKAYYFNGQARKAEPHFHKAFIIMSAYARKATNSTAKDFYVGYEDQIVSYWTQNKRALEPLNLPHPQAK